MWKKYGTGPNDPTTREEREEIGDSLLGLYTLSYYKEIENKLKIRGKSKVSINELNEIIEKIRGEERLKMISR